MNYTELHGPLITLENIREEKALSDWPIYKYNKSTGNWLKDNLGIPSEAVGTIVFFSYIHSKNTV